MAISLMASGMLYLAVDRYLINLELVKAQSAIVKQQDDIKTTLFTRLFIDKVLLSKGTVNFEDRLKLENAVRDMSDPEVFKKWQDFVSCTDDVKAQEIVGTMLRLLVDRMSS